MTSRTNRLGAAIRRDVLWTPREYEVLMKSYRTIGPTRLAVQLGRTVAAVKTKARDLGLTRKGCEKSAEAVSLIF